MTNNGKQRRSVAAQGIAGAAAALVLLGACSASVGMTENLDTDKGEDYIKTFLAGKVAAPVGEVTCPERPLKQGDVFECTTQVDGQALRVQVTQDDDEGNVSVKLAQAVLDIQQAVPYVEQEVAKAKGTAMKADCGPQRYLVRDPGATFDCRVTPKAGRAAPGRVIVTVKDVAGTVDLRLA